jgi:DNA repair exonuclease SbcCD ATPase subunit
MEALVEEKVTNISEAIQGFHACIVDLEACVTPSTPLEEREKREQRLTTIVESINNLEVECAHLYTKTMGIWTQLSEYREQQEIIQKIQVALGKGAQKFKAVMGTLPPTEVVTTMDENRKLY